ncbi:MAG: hypothetical protein IPP19_06425 [Verrucomicrobia bacterium]|nr:hypothetical protein [Verrucomicrobiota bacterium]
MSNNYCSFDYTVAGCRSLKPSSFPNHPKVWWNVGALINEALVPKPYTGKLDPFNEDSDEQIMPEVMSGWCSSLVMREDLLKAFLEAGVDNLQLFDAEITDPDSGKVYTNYKAVNIVGCIAAADLRKSEYTEHGNGPVIDVDFDKLVIEDKKPDGTLMFRLAESINVILLHKKVRDHLLTKNFPFLRFYEVGDIAT